MSEFGGVFPDPKAVREAFRTHLVTLAARYKKQIAGPLDDEEALRLQEENTTKAKDHRQRLVCFLITTRDTMLTLCLALVT